ncbi:MAG: GNAT family N-acetyltransferase [Bacillota bacterium]
MRLIRPYRVEELPTVMHRAHASAFDQLVERERGHAQPDGVARQLREMYRMVLATPGATLLVAEGAGLPEPGPAGHALLFPQANPFTGVGEMVVMDIWVHPAARGMGVGSALVQEAERHTRAIGGRSLVAQIALHNQASQALFRRAGFQQERVVTGKGW